MANKYGIQLKGTGRALRPSGLGALRPKPTGKGGKPLKPKPIRPGKKDGGKVIRKYPDGSDIPRPFQKKPLKEKILPKKKKDRLKELRKELGMKKGGRAKFPDLTGDGKVTRADVLKGRGVFAKGGTSIDAKADLLRKMGATDKEKEFYLIKGGDTSKEFKKYKKRKGKK